MVKFTKHRRLPGKRNEVWLGEACFEDGSERRAVLKQFADFRALDTEVYIHGLLVNSGVPVATLLAREGNCLFYGYLEGKNLVGYLELEEAGKIPEGENAGFFLMCDWLCAFYKSLRERTGESLILGDIHLRNFIYGDRLYGVDFEACTAGDYEEDIGKLCAFILTYSPAHTEFKFELARQIEERMVLKLSLDAGMVRHSLKKELAALEIRRGNSKKRD